MDSATVGINQLPLQILSEIFSCLTFCQRKDASLVCKKWYEAAQDPLFLASTCVKLNEECDQKEILEGLGRRGIPNLNVILENMSSITDRIDSHFKADIKYLCLTGFVNIHDIIWSAKQFPNLRTLEVKPKRFEMDSFLCGEHWGGKLCRRLSKAINNLPNLIFHLPIIFNGYDVEVFASHLSSVENLSLLSEFDKAETGFPYLDGSSLVELLKSSKTLVQSLQELDISWVSISSSFHDFLQIPNLNIRSLKFTCEDQNNLINLANSSLSLETLEVLCEGRCRSLIRYPVIDTLLTEKSCVKVFTCRSVLYVGHSGLSEGPLEDVFSEWPDIQYLEVKPRRIADDVYGDTERQQTIIDFCMLKDQDCCQKHVGITTLGPINEDAIIALVNHSPGLRGLWLEPWGHMVELEGMFAIGQRLEQLEEFKIMNFDLGPVGSEMEMSLCNGHSQLRNLRALSLNHCAMVQGLTELSLPSLKHLWLTNCSMICGDDITSLDTTIELVGLGGCNITDECFLAIASHMNRLRCLLISNCSRITKGMAPIIAKSCQSLEFIDVTGCNDSFISALKELRQSMPFLHRIIDSHDLPGMLHIMKADQWGFALEHAVKEAVATSHPSGPHSRVYSDHSDEYSSD